jgi:hypothetical protein
MAEEVWISHQLYPRDGQARMSPILFRTSRWEETHVLRRLLYVDRRKGNRQP